MQVALGVASASTLVGMGLYRAMRYHEPNEPRSKHFQMSLAAGVAFPLLPVGLGAVAVGSAVVLPFYAVWMLLFPGRFKVETVNGIKIQGIGQGTMNL